MQVVPRAKTGFVTTPACRHHPPASATSARSATKTRLEDVGLETGSSYSDACAIDRHVVSNAKLGFVTTPSMSAPSSSFGDVSAVLYEDPTRDVGLETGSSYSDVCAIDRHVVSNAKLGL